jgi:Family of unknown function (DUF6084)
MNVRPEAAGTAVPAPELTVVSAAHERHAAAPTMVFALAVSEPEGHDIYTIALTVQIQIDPAKRGYDPDTRLRLQELFGPPGQGAASTQSLVWARVDALVPSFLGSTTVELRVPCTYDLEVATAKYFHALAGGEVPLSFHFTGTVFYRGPDGTLQVVLIPWDTDAQFRMPVATWRAMIDEHYPAGGFIRLQDATLVWLNGRRTRRGLPSFDACVSELLEACDGG